MLILSPIAVESCNCATSNLRRDQKSLKASGVTPWTTVDPEDPHQGSQVKVGQKIFGKCLSQPHFCSLQREPLPNFHFKYWT